MTLVADELDYDRLTDSELRELLDMPEGREGLKYYLSKQQKIDFIRATDVEDEGKQKRLLGKARKAQEEHHRYLKESRGRGPTDKGKMIEDKLKGDRWRFIRKEKVAKGFRDAATNRKAKLAFILESVVSGDQIRVCRSTVEDAHARLGLVMDWPPKPNGAMTRIVRGAVTATDLPERNTVVHRHR